MNNLEFKSVIHLMQAFPTEQSCIDHLEALWWKGEPVSPFDPESKVYKCKNGRYRCKNTGKYFNVRTGTMFDNTKVPLQKWFYAIWLATSHKKGISSMQLGKDIGVTQKTAWFLLHRIRECFAPENEGVLTEEVEIDETFVGGKNKNRHFDKKVKYSQGRSFKDKVPVVGMLERGGRLIAKQVEDTKAGTLLPLIRPYLGKSAVVYTDEWPAYTSLRVTHAHYIVRHGQGQYTNGRATTNSIEGFWAILKRGIIGIYHKVSKKHLQRYVDEFVFRYNYRSSTETQRFTCLLLNLQNRLTYKELIA